MKGSLLPAALVAAVAVAAPAALPPRPQGTIGAGASGPAARLSTLAIEDARASSADDLPTLAAAARSSDAGQARAAVRALGRLERREVISRLLPLLHAGDAGTCRGSRDGPRTRGARPARLRFAPEPQWRTVVDALAAAPGDAAFRGLGHLPCATAAQFHQIERLLVPAATQAPVVGQLRGLEALARLNKKFLPLEDATLERVRAAASEHSYPTEVRRNAMAALAAASGADDAVLTRALADPDAEVRRFAALALGSPAPVPDSARRAALVQSALGDASPLVRLEALKAWVHDAAAARGCGPLLNALADGDANVRLYAADALGEQCRADNAVTERLAAGARVPAPGGSWQGGAHALVAVARRDRARARALLPRFVPSATWQLRMYAARAAAAMDDAATLERLAGDPEDNVREAVLPGLRRLRGAASDATFVAALDRQDYQLLRTAARELKGTGPSAALAASLGRALVRVTAERKDTSRDPRLAIIERLGELGAPTDAPVIRPLLRDYDPVVAAAAAQLLQRWTGDTIVAAPQPLPRAPLPAARELIENVEAVVTMEGGGAFRLAFESEQAPLTRGRFVRLARARYYDGLTFHRVVPNAFIQGGSPHANEYAGDRLYMRDEVGLPLHTRGTVGISTRGRDTGDAQFFINLVDNPFLDYEYTVFAHVCSGMETVDRIQEGARMTNVKIVEANGCRIDQSAVGSRRSSVVGRRSSVVGRRSSVVSRQSSVESSVGSRLRE